MTSMQQYFIGLPISKYEDFRTIIDRILSGSMMKDPRVEFEDITDTDIFTLVKPLKIPATLKYQPLGICMLPLGIYMLPLGISNCSLKYHQTP